jgi:hypothetical protein
LDLADAPLRAARVPHEGAGYEAGVQSRAPLAPIELRC